MVESPVALASALISWAEAKQRNLLVQASETGSSIANAELPGRKSFF